MIKLLLFDIDKTLLQSSSSHEKSFEIAFKKVYGIETNIFTINPHGMTDQQIILEVLMKEKLERKEVVASMDKCMAEMVHAFKESVARERIFALKGVPELLAILSKKEIIMGLVTGNLEQIGRGKLRKAGLNKYFKIGGFGSDHMIRTKLVEIAIEKAVKKFELKILPKETLLFGDTPLDIQAGREAGVKTVGVATGNYSIKQLLKAKSDFVLKSLKNRNEILEMLRNN